MNKSIFKNAIIGLLLTVNIFLFVNLVHIRATTGNVDQTARESFVKILKGNNIQIEENLVPKKYEERKKVYVEFYDINKLKQIFVSSGAEYVSDGQSVSAAMDDKIITVRGKTFEYSTLHEKVEKDGKKIIKALKKKGIYSSGAFFDKTDGLVKVKIDDCLIESVYLDVSLDKNGEIAYAKGVWPKVTVGDEAEYTSLVQAVGDILDEIPSGSVIESVKKVYRVNKEDSGSYLTSAWRLYCGDKYYTVQG
ncbi:MAG: hypothetical protein ACI3XA_02290 [Clostridia bacterium]